MANRHTPSLGQSLAFAAIAMALLLGMPAAPPAEEIPLGEAASGSAKEGIGRSLREALHGKTRREARTRDDLIQLGQSDLVYGSSLPKSEMVNRHEIAPWQGLALATVVSALSIAEPLTPRERGVSPEETAPEVSTGEIAQSLRQSLKEKLWAEVYSQGVFSRLDRRNFVTDTTMKMGMPVFSLFDRDVEAYLKTRVLYDKNADFWNNIAEVGLGLRYRPFRKYGLILFGEGVYGRYTGREGLDKNLDDAPYVNFIGGAAFWQRWGAEVWQLDRPARLYWPFFGWREMYADSIFTRRDRKNVISSVSYREGLLMGKLSKLSYEAFLVCKAGIDRNADHWNNYVRYGPGIALAPLEGVELNVSFEWLWGSYYRGIPEGDFDKSFRDFVVTVTFSKSW